MLHLDHRSQWWACLLRRDTANRGMRFDDDDALYAAMGKRLRAASSAISGLSR